MGWDISIESIYSTGLITLSWNEKEIYVKYDVYPRDFNNMMVKEIIPRYIKARDELIDFLKSKKKYKDHCEFKKMITWYNQKDFDKLLPEQNALWNIINLLTMLMQYDPEAVWKCL